MGWPEKERTTVHFAVNHHAYPGNQNKAIWVLFFGRMRHFDVILWLVCRCAGSPSVAVSGSDVHPGRPQRVGLSLPAVSCYT